jgi:hypothetical protein
MIAFHGTTKEAFKKIKKQGLIPNGSPGADQWAKKNFHSKMKPRKDKEPSVFISFDRTYAARFAQIAGEVRNETPIVLEIHIPDEEAQTRLHEDEASFDWNLRRFKGAIDPKWIKNTLDPWEFIPKDTNSAVMKPSSHLFETIEGREQELEDLILQTLN